MPCCRRRLLGNKRPPPFRGKTEPRREQSYLMDSVVPTNPELGMRSLKSPASNSTMTSARCCWRREGFGAVAHHVICLTLQLHVIQSLVMLRLDLLSQEVHPCARLALLRWLRGIRRVCPAALLCSVDARASLLAV